MGDARKPNRNWSREQTLLAFQFYCETPFGQLHGRNPKIVALAGLIGRTPSAVAMKCVNFASLDPQIRESGRSGLTNVSALDRRVWEEFHSNWDALIDECEAVRSRLQDESGIRDASQDDNGPDFEGDFTGDTRTAVVRLRVRQEFFRRAVLSGYGYKCCISGVSEPRLLVASHIVPWKEDASIRLHPGNGLCLSAIHDRAFDKYLFSLTDDYRVLLSTRLKCTRDRFLQDVFLPIEGTAITLPERFVPQQDFVQRHRGRMLDSDAAR